MTIVLDEPVPLPLARPVLTIVDPAPIVDVPKRRWLAGLATGVFALSGDLNDPLDDFAACRSGGWSSILMR